MPWVSFSYSSQFLFTVVHICFQYKISTVCFCCVFCLFSQQTQTQLFFFCYLSTQSEIYGSSLNHRKIYRFHTSHCFCFALFSVLFMHAICDFCLHFCFFLLWYTFCSRKVILKYQSVSMFCLSFALRFRLISIHFPSSTDL